MNRKKIILIALVIILIVAGVIIYFTYFRKKKTETAMPKQETVINKISDEKVYFPSLSGDNETIYCLKKYEDKGALTKYSLKTNQNSQIPNTEVNYPFAVIWSPKNDQAIIQADKYKTPPKILHTSGILNYLFRANNTALKSLDSNIQEVAFDFNGEKIVYQYSDNINKIYNISISKSDGSGWQKLFDADTYEDYNLFWPDKDHLLYFVEPTASYSSSLLYKYDFTANQSSEIGNGTQIVNIMYNNKKQNLIYEFYKDKKSFLGTMNLDGSNKKELDLAYSIEKIAILPSGNEIVTAVSNGGNNSDKFYKVNLDNGEKTELTFQSQDKVQAFNLMATSDGKTVYFTSQDDSLYKLEL
jgi:hypothetical protein